MAVNVKGLGLKQSFSNISGSAGLAWQATEKLNIKLNAAEVSGRPAYQRAANGAHEGALTKVTNTVTIR